MGSTGSTASRPSGTASIGQNRPVPSHSVASGAARDDRDPGGQPGSRRVVAAQKSEIVLAQAEKDLLRQILDLSCLARYTPDGCGNEAGIAPHKRFPRSLVPARERVQLAPLRQSGCPTLLVGGCGRPHPRIPIRPQPSALKKSFPLSSMTMKAGKSTTSIRQTASIPSSGYSTTSTLRTQSWARRAAGPPIEPR